MAIQKKEERSKKIRYENRKKCMLKKAEELSTLCDVKVCAIIIPPATASGEKIKLETWPRNLNDVKAILDAFKTSHNTVRSEQPHKYRTKGPSITHKKKHNNNNKDNNNNNNNNVVSTTNDTTLCLPSSPLLFDDNWSLSFLKDFERGADMMDTNNAVGAVATAIVPHQWYGNNGIINPPPISSVSAIDQNMLVNHSYQWNGDENENSFGNSITYGAGYDESGNMGYYPSPVQYPSTNIGPNMAIQGSTFLPPPNYYSNFGYFAV